MSETAPYAFTEQGVALQRVAQHRAIQVNIEIMRSFVQLRQMFNSLTALRSKLLAVPPQNP